MTDTRPIARCQEKACPCIGRFATGYCPLHVRDAPRRAAWCVADVHRAIAGGEPADARATLLQASGDRSGVGHRFVSFRWAWR